jgi:hypothetical protein
MCCLPGCCCFQMSYRLLLLLTIVSNNSEQSLPREADFAHSGRQYQVQWLQGLQDTSKACMHLCLYGCLCIQSTSST